MKQTAAVQKKRKKREKFWKEEGKNKSILGYCGFVFVENHVKNGENRKNLVLF